VTGGNKAEKRFGFRVAGFGLKKELKKDDSFPFA
jgi:hypothetical protein